MHVENHMNVAFYSMADRGTGRSSEIERSLMMRWVVGSILHGVDPLSYFSFLPVFQVHTNTHVRFFVRTLSLSLLLLLLFGKSSSCGGSGFPLSLSEWSFTILSDAI